MRVLIVEDDRRIADVIRDGLEEVDFVVDTVAGGDDAVRAATSQTYDVVVLDVMLGPGPDGFDVCRRLRERNVPSAVLMLTALDGVPSRVRGLDVGADDYLVKPFAFTELVARLRALVRRHEQHRMAVHVAGGLRLDAGSRRVTLDGVELELTRKEFDILELLVSHPDHVLSKDRIHDSVWPDELSLGSNLVEVYMARLRRKLAAAQGADLITTVRNVGYRFERDAPAGVDAVR